MNEYVVMIFFIKLMKLKPSFFMGIDYEDAYAFIVDCFYLLHKMNIVEWLSVEFVTY